MEIKYFFQFIKVWAYFKKFIGWIRKSSIKNDEKLDVSKVIAQGSISTYVENNELGKLKVSDLCLYFSEFAKKNIDAKYLKDGTVLKDDKLPEEDKVKFLINNTRISTFFIFTDGNKVVLLDRTSTEPGFHRVENDITYDAFGSVTFENCSIKLKLTKNNFLKVKVEKIEGIPGVAFEDSVEPEDNLFGRQTVVMLGFAIFVSNEDLLLAKSNKSYKMETFDLDSVPDHNVLSAKAKLSVDYLQHRMCD